MKLEPKQIFISIILIQCQDLEQSNIKLLYYGINCLPLPKTCNLLFLCEQVDFNLFLKFDIYFMFWVEGGSLFHNTTALCLIVLSPDIVLE